jgi:drug/metabolite transporter (DMT)-like permease
VTPANNRPRALLLWGLLTLMIALWSLNFIAGKIALHTMPALTLAAFRLEVAALILLGIYLVAAARRRANPPAVATGRKFSFRRADLWTFVRLGFLGVIVNQVCFTVGLSYTDVGHASLIIGMGPIIVLLLASMQGLEALTTKKVIGMAAAFVGVAVLAAEHGLSLHSATLRGDLITFIGSIGFSLYTVFSKKVAAEYETLAMNTFNYLVAAVLLLPLAIRQAREISVAPGGWASPGWTGWAGLGFMALFASVIAYLIYFWALRYMAASRVATIGYLQPVATTLMGIAWLGERFTQSLLIGGALIFAGVYAIESGPRESPTKPR